MKILDIGCGKNKYISKNKEDLVIGIDMFNFPGVDISHNLEKIPWPVKDNEFDKVICSHILEHVGNLTEVMNEIWRVCKNGSEIIIYSPYFSNYGAYTDITHKHFFTSESFDYFDPSTKLFNQYSSKNNLKFNIIEKKLIFGRPFNLFSKIFNNFIGFYERFLPYLFPARQIYFKLEVIKK